jgi:hypothetical protein
MYLKVIVNVQEEVTLEGLRNVQILTKGFFPGGRAKVERTEVVVTSKLDGDLKPEQKMFLDHLQEEGVIKEHHTSQHEEIW